MRSLGFVIVAMIAATCLCQGCNVRQFAVNSLADAVAQGTGAYARDDDPELIREALPFALKLTEGLLEENPRHRGLLLAACSGFTQYSYGFVEQDADMAEPTSLSQAAALRARARKLYLRARDYGLRGLEVAHKDLPRQLQQDPRSALRRARRADVPLLYWTAASWGLAIQISKDDPHLIADQPIVEALIDRALELDESFDDGAIHSFLVTYEMVRQGAGSDPAQRARQHYRRAIELSGGQSAAPMVALAEAVCVMHQQRDEFHSLLTAALAIDPNARPNLRLSNLIMQQRARWLLSREEELFVE